MIMTHSHETERTPRLPQQWDELVTLLNHELRNPLAPIRTALELMAMRAPQQFSREREIIQRQVKQLVSVLDGLLIESDGEAESKPGKEGSDTPLRVLVVDDNVDAAEMLSWLLEELGCETEVAHDGPTALERARQFDPQLALLDIGLPVMDGYELASRLRQAVDGVRLVAVTAYGQPSDRRRSEQAGFEAHFVKPLDVNELTPLLHD
jgi:CheY-like chemotaxis protein